MLKPKKSGLDVMVAVGKPKGDPKSDLSGPDPLDGPDEESSETPEEEQTEETGGDLLTDMLKPLVDLGASEQEAKSALASIFKSAAACLAGGKEEAPEGQPPAMPPAAAGPESYGR
jgi:hypothetical protein